MVSAASLKSSLEETGRRFEAEFPNVTRVIISAVRALLDNSLSKGPRRLVYIRGNGADGSIGREGDRAIRCGSVDVSKCIGAD